jgi:hypothetical protein
VIDDVVLEVVVVVEVVEVVEVDRPTMSRAHEEAPWGV